MFKLLSLIGALSMGSSAISPTLVSNENNVEVINENNYIDGYKSQAMSFTDGSIQQLAYSLQFTSIFEKVVYIQRSYPMVSQAYDYLNYVEHTQEIVQAKKLLLDGADLIDLAARQGNPDTMNYYVGDAIQALSTALKYIAYNTNDGYKNQAMNFTDGSIHQLAYSVQFTSIFEKVVYIQRSYPMVSQAYDYLNYVEHTQEIVQAKKLLLDGADLIDLAARQGNPDTMNYYVGDAIQALSTALKYIGLSMI
ncbi:hypothetical protein [Spiroplasma culicicola]|uniref:Transmembrane protein n=1 Tax=Spiroplasma culicicola AES-1 TaxID=1276246 RepID=W6A7P6_9MOLU|nr:hypothetical protein [Spiroplasma culicicola]AHI53163.1 hypothetical protein SCULI_v1c08230 [Spiroplasma culicicola AES-1]